MGVYGQKPQVPLSGLFPLEVLCSAQLSYGRVLWLADSLYLTEFRSLCHSVAAELAA
jgi:hypothetical protein